MVDAVTAVGIVGAIATALMILGMLYLTYLGMRADRHGLDVEPESDPDPE